jgi:undecaprenyl pyrophosphate phosphatase UppP
LLTAVLMYFSANIVMYGRSDLFVNTQKTPNKNKYTRWLFVCRMSAPTIFLTGIFSYPKDSIWVTMISFVFLGVTLSLYMLCVDKPTPKSKTSRNKSNNFSFVG